MASTIDTIYDILRNSLSTDGALRISGGTVGGATEATLLQVRDNLADIEGYVDQLESYTNELESMTSSLITVNTAIEDSVDGLESLVTSLNSAVDGVEGLISSANTALGTIASAVDSLEGYTDTLESQNASILAELADINANTSNPPADAATATKQDVGNASLASIDGKLASLGQKNMAGSMPVVFASDQGALTVASAPDASTASALTAVTASTATTTILSANSNRKRAFLYNDSSSSAVVALSTTATSTLYTHKMGPYGFWEVPGDPVWRGAVAAIWDVANGALRVTELT